MTIEGRAQRFKPLMNDEYGRDLIAEARGLHFAELAAGQRVRDEQVVGRAGRHVVHDSLPGAGRQ